MAVGAEGHEVVERIVPAILAVDDVVSVVGDTRPQVAALAARQTWDLWLPGRRSRLSLLSLKKPPRPLPYGPEGKPVPERDFPTTKGPVNALVDRVPNRLGPLKSRPLAVGTYGLLSAPVLVSELPGTAGPINSG